MAKRKSNEVAYLAFLLGLIWVLLAAGMDVGIVAAFIPVNVTIIGLIGISLLVSFSNIEDKEIERFLLVAITLTVVSLANFTVPYIGEFLNRVLEYLKFLVLPGTLLIAMRAGYHLLKD